VQTWEYAAGYAVRHAHIGGDGTRVTAIERDAEGRITRVSGPDGDTTYEHDDGGQLVAAVHDGERTDWSYDLAGRLVEERAGSEARRFSHDAAGQLGHVETSDGASEHEHEHDGAGRRVRSTRSGGPMTDYRWDARGRLVGVIETTETTASTTELHVDAIGELAHIDGLAVDWDTASAVPSLLAIGDAPVMRAPGGLTGVGGGWTAGSWRTARSTTQSDPWQALADLSDAVLPVGIAVGTDGSLQVAGLEWMGARAYDPTSRGFLSVDPRTAPAGAGNDPLHAVDPLGLAPVSDAELQAYAAAEQGPLARAAAAAGDWFQDNWEYVAGGAMVVAGGVLLATGVGGPVGAMLISAGADTIIQKATTGEVNWGQVAVSGAFGALGGGAGALLGRHLLGNAAEGAVENIASYAVSGQPVTPGGLLRNAAEGAATSAATGGTMSKVHLPTAVNKLGDEAATPSTSIYRGVNESHHAYDAATEGDAWPGDILGHSDGRAHALGMTEDSNLTSWTTDRSVAERFASDGSGQGVATPGGRGVIMSTTMEEHADRIVPGPDVLGESEVLLRGIVSDVNVERYGH
jgi:YD repeat-containing protein